MSIIYLFKLHPIYIRIIFFFLSFFRFCSHKTVSLM